MLYDREKIIELLTSDQKKDTHIHTCFSDGELTPEQVIDRWMNEGYRVISITDHDGIDGTLVGVDYAKDKDIEFIPGIEFDSEDPLSSEIHMLGYGFDHLQPDFKENIEAMLERRDERNKTMQEALNKRGYGITDEDVRSVNGGRYVGKPTFARIMVNKGIIGSVQEAFSGIFREPDMRAIKKETFPAGFVIWLIHEAGGVAVMAHPMEQRKSHEPWKEFEPRLYTILDKMVRFGVDGIECYHPSADEQQSELLVKYAKEHNLIITRGSDFHSDVQKRDFSRYHGMD